MKSILAVCLVVAVLLAIPVVGQVAIGTPPMGSFGGGPFDIINLGNLNSHFAIPVRHKAGRQVPFVYDISYDSSIWTPTNVNGTTTWMPPSFGSYWGWQGLSATSGIGGLTYTTTTNSGSCGQSGTNHWNSTQYSNFVYTDENGAHSFGGYYTVWISTDGQPGTCPNAGSQPSTVSGVPAIDGSGFTLYAIATASGISQNVTSRTGVSFSGIGGIFNSIDANGNQLSTASGGVFTDTLGQTALTVAGMPPSNTTLSYTAPSLATAQYTVSYVSYTVKTNFGCFRPSIREYNVAGIYLVDRITLPDSSFYQFTYEQTPGDSNPNHVTARIATITLPTGGTITYSYTGGTKGVLCADGSTSGLTRTLNPGGTWTYTRAQGAFANLWTTTVTTPPDPTVGNQTVINFAKDSSTTFDSNFYETQRQVYQGSSTLLRTTINCWNGNFTNCATQSVTSPITQLDAYKQLPSGTLSLSETKYNYGLVTEDKEFDWGVALGSAPTTSPINDTVTTYTSLGKPSTVVVKDGSSNVVSNTSYGYDESSLQATSGTPQHVSVSSPRGNNTTISRTVAGSSVLTQHFTYYDTGNVYQATDVNNAVTTYSYGGCGNSFVTSVAMPLSLSTSATWDCVGGVQKSSTDANGNVTTTTYSDPYFWRAASITYPDTGQTSFTYNSPNVTTTTRKMNGTQSLVTETALDGFGRTIEKELFSDPEGAVYADTFYNSLGQAYCFSNPYRATSSPTDGQTCYEFDALGRATKVTNPDNTYQTITYSNRATEVQDEGNGTSRVAKIYQSDGLGRLTSVCEVTSATQLGNGGTPSACGQDIAATGFLTTYTYDTLGNLLSVAQPGVTNRSYQYDELSRLTQSYDPEIGSTILYNYDSCSAGDLCSRTAPKPNQTGSATVTTSYNYDLLHRLGGKTYSDGVTNSVVFLYDQTAPWGWNILNPKGNLTEEYTATSSGAVTEQMFERDSMGRLIETGSCTPINCSGNAYHFVYTYDLLGNILTENNDREGVTYTNSYNAAAQLTNFQSSLVNSTHPGNLYTVNQYNPLGEIQQATFGNGIVRNATYDNRGRITSQTDGSIYSFSLGLAADSNVLTGNDSVNGNWTYTYDGFNRLATSTQASGSAFNYQYDRFGNRWQQNITAGSGPAPSYIFDGGNRTPSFLYDAAGNIINDGVHTYTYDAEGRMLTVDGGSTATYVYDASGRRVEETVNGGAPIDFIYDQQGHAVTEATASVWDRSELYAGGGHVALYANGTTYFMHTDWLGSTKNQSDMSGNSAQWCTYLPFADGFSCPGSQLSLMSFTGDQWDGETGLSHTQFRQYNPTQGRWMTPDPAGMAAADPTNPQSWNRYAYVMNNPLAMVDPLGLFYAVPICSGMSIRVYGMCVDVSEILIPGCYVNLLYGGGFGGIGCGAPPNIPTESTSTSAGGGTSANNGRVPNNITCSTVLPNGRTVGSYVSQLSNSINQQAQVAPVSTPYGPAPNPSFPGPISVASQVYSGTNFRAMFGGPGANYAFLGDAGNFAYGAVSANLGVPLSGAEMVAGAYSLYAHPSSDWGWPWGMDPSARVQVPAGYSAQCK